MKQSMKLLAALALLFMITPSFAQVTVNPKVGLNVSALDAKLQDLDAEVRAGWNAGLDLRIGEGFFFLNPGVHYYSYTARLLKENEIDNPEDIKLKDETTIQSVRLPLNVGFRLTGDNGLLGIHAKGGITPSYVLGVNEKENFDFNVKDLNRFNYGANLGVGIDIAFLTVDVTYEIGLKDYFQSAEGRNNMLTASVGIKF